HSKSAIPAADFLQFALDFRDPSITCSKAPSRAMSPSLIVNQFGPASRAGDDDRPPDMSSEKTPVHFCGTRDSGSRPAIPSYPADQFRGTAAATSTGFAR